MAAFDPATLDRWRALAIVDRDGTTVGTISEFYLDRETGYPSWALVNTGLFGAHQTFVPLVHATEIADGLQVPYAKSHIKDAPRVDLHDELTPAEEATLFAHYGVDYEPSPEQAATTVEGPGPVPAQPGPAEAPAQARPGPAETPAPGPAQDGSAAAEPGQVGSAEASAADAGVGSAVEAVDGGPGSVPPEPTETTPAEPGTDEATAGRDGLRPDAADGAVPDEPGTTDPDEATRVDQQGLRAEGLEPEGPEAAPPRGEPPAEGDPDLSRTAPVEPGLPGSTAASPYGPPSTIDKEAEQPAQEPVRSQDEVAWPPGPAGGFEEQVPLDRPARSSDRWREAKQAAERERATRTPSTPPEERSPLERARRRLERLVGVGQEPPDPEDISPTDQDAAERARRARLGLDEDDNRRR
jgi:PRC-barrel domain